MRPEELRFWRDRKRKDEERDNPRPKRRGDEFNQD